MPGVPQAYDAPSTTSLTPYLTLPHLLSLTWLAYPILSLIFVAFRLQLSLDDAQNSIASAKSELVASCKAAETAATSAASMPRFMAIATNKQYADAVNGTLNAARATLILALTIMEAIINFLIDIYRSTFLCFLELIVQSGLAVLIAAVQEINNVLSTVTSALRTNIQNDIATANNVINTAINAINKVNPFGNITPPQITVPSLDSLQNVTLPASFMQALTNLNSSIPSVSQLKNDVEGLIDQPFELVKQDINATFANITLTPDGLPVPALDSITFCNQLDTSVIDDIGHDLIKMAKIGIIIIALLVLLLIGLNCLLTWYKWRCMKNHLEYQRQAWNTDPTIVHAKGPASPQVTLSDHNLILLQANSEHPLVTRIMNTLSGRLHLTPAQYTNTQWFLHYVTYRPALACFLIGFFGLLSVQIQLWALGPLVAKYQDRATQATTDFSSTIASSINASMYNQSSLYANDINTRIDVIQSTVNDGLFGWVNGTTTTLNTTLNNFYSDVQNVVNTVFGNTILSAPANAFLQCFIGSKVDAIENALTFLHDNLIIDIPRVNQSVLILSPDAVNEAAQPIALAAIGGDSNNGTESTGLVGRLVNSYAASLRKERIMFSIFMGLWGVVVLMGLAVVLWHTHGKRIIAERGRRRYEREQRAGGAAGLGAYFDERAARSSGSLDGNTEKGVRMSEEKLNSFSPLPSPRGSTFKPFWPSRANSPAETAVARPSQETVAGPAQGPWEAAFPAPPAVQAPKKTTRAKLLAVGRRAVKRGERLKKDGSEDLQEPAVQPDSAAKPPSAWLGKMSALLSRKETQRSADADYWDTPQPPMEEERQTPPPLQAEVPHGYDTSQELQADPQMQSRFSVTPDATKTSYPSLRIITKKITSPPPTRPTVVVSSPEAYPSSFPTYTYSPDKLSPYQRQMPPSGTVPTDVRISYTDDPFSGAAAASSVLPVPTYASFNTSVAQYGAPPRHPQLQGAFGSPARRSHSASAAVPPSPPPPPQSPRGVLTPTALTPPPHRTSQHSRSVSSGAVTVLRVTNAAPGDYSTSSLSLADDARSHHRQSQSWQRSASGGTTPVSPVSQYLAPPHGRQSTLVNPFITPFDDEHRVQIDYTTGMGARKSMATNPFAHAM